MGKQTDLLPHIMDIKERVVRMETAVSTMGDLPGRLTKAERDIAEVRTTARTIWRVVVAIPLLGAVLAFFGIPHFANSVMEIHR